VRLQDVIGKRAGAECAGFFNQSQFVAGKLTVELLIEIHLAFSARLAR
jgi:hypothetical protein